MWLVGAFDGGVGADYPAAFAVGAFFGAFAFFGAACAGFGFRVGLVILEPLACAGASAAGGYLIGGEAGVLGAAGVFDGAVDSGGGFAVGGLLLGVSVSERVQGFVEGLGRFGIARGFRAASFPLFPRTPFTPILRLL